MKRTCLKCKQLKEVQGFAPKRPVCLACEPTITIRNSDQHGVCSHDLTPFAHPYGENRPLIRVECAESGEDLTKKHKIMYADHVMGYFVEFVNRTTYKIHHRPIRVFDFGAKRICGVSSVVEDRNLFLGRA